MIEISIGYLGPRGSYSEAVCNFLYPRAKHPNWRYIEYPNLLSLMQAIESGEITLGLIPAQNSKCGILKDVEGHEFLTRLINSSKNLQIVAEKFWALEFLLLGHAESNLNQIRIVHVNPYAEEQCLEYLNSHSSWQIKKQSSSSQAAKAVTASHDLTEAAIASSSAAREYQLKILDKNIFKPGSEPIMHFLVLSSDLTFKPDADISDSMISSFVVILSPDEAKNLAFVHPSLKITLIRPSNDRPGYYFLDLQGQFFLDDLVKILGRDKVYKWIGTFPSCPSRVQFEKLFSG